MTQLKGYPKSMPHFTLKGPYSLTGGFGYMAWDQQTNLNWPKSLLSLKTGMERKALVAPKETVSIFPFQPRVQPSSLQHFIHPTSNLSSVRRTVTQAKASVDFLSNWGSQSHNYLVHSRAASLEHTTTTWFSFQSLFCTRTQFKGSCTARWKHSALAVACFQNEGTLLFFHTLDVPGAWERSGEVNLFM